ncbi:hypothetical protein CLAFUW4_08704 [Fulvia fulva]|uniref:Uncharacterized protein n=1 Tax=Passalora fulva TaxID=5499 RepID=A0A9Q8PGV5_PASFU|nr:uncharacterized protein CLAFUR5_08803 [Fulvia fulva]KAK4613647.1 hypothetical protein CLAFUR4_08709 [Fulvia fulva]KAK4615142.1 hypothetical protein CLAFUR0_08705 [Fulvia fulva]UJO22275.1 hypothetical protein CLAFUR5_08803 [Fulvia fulva]WPV20024.1 hypothetical protein CLAFUW4_08704 [Fulvia fulva]WPV35122.1 hypothetical protein CLAFUW7_08704 [Fulvia fulva]
MEGMRNYNGYLSAPEHVRQDGTGSNLPPIPATPPPTPLPPPQKRPSTTAQPTSSHPALLAFLFGLVTGLD